MQEVHAWAFFSVLANTHQQTLLALADYVANSATFSARKADFWEKDPSTIYRK